MSISGAHDVRPGRLLPDRPPATAPVAGRVAGLQLTMDDRRAPVALR